jgi:tripartite tricarboxylate transporter TctB family protein
MDQDVQPKAEASGGGADRPGRNGQPEEAKPDLEPQDDAVVDEPVDEPVDDADHARDERVTRVVHIVLGLFIVVLGAWLLYRSHTELAFRGPNGEPGPGYLPVLLTSCLIVMGLLLAAVWAFGKKARQGEAPTLSLHPRQMGRALLVWGALVVCGFLIEPLGFLVAGEVFVLLIMAIERIKSIVLIVTLLLVPPLMYLLFDTLLEVQLPGGTLWY